MNHSENDLQCFIVFTRGASNEYPQHNDYKAQGTNCARTTDLCKKVQRSPG